MTSWTSNALTLFQSGNYGGTNPFNCATGQGAVNGIQALPQPPYDQKDWSMFTTNLANSYKDACMTGSNSYAADHQAARTGWTQFVNSVNAKWPTLGQQLETAPLNF